MWYLSTNISSGQTNCSVLASGAHTSSVDLVDIECFLMTRREKSRKERMRGRRVGNMIRTNGDMVQST